MADSVRLRVHLLVCTLRLVELIAHLSGMRGARVRHLCSECLRWIEPGERYRLTVYGELKPSGLSYRYTNIKQCADCVVKQKPPEGG